MENENQVREDKRALRIKQGMIWGLSVVLGLVLSYLIVIGLGSDIATYSVKYFILTVIPIAMLFVIWGDYLLGAQILPE